MEQPWQTLPTYFLPQYIMAIGTADTKQMTTAEQLADIADKAASLEVDDSGNVVTADILALHDEIRSVLELQPGQCDFYLRSQDTRLRAAFDELAMGTVDSPDMTNVGGDYKEVVSGEEAAGLERFVRSQIEA